MAFTITKKKPVPAGTLEVKPLTPAAVAQAAAVLEAEKLTIGEGASLRENLRLQVETAIVVLVGIRTEDGQDPLAGLDRDGVRTLLTETPGLLTAITETAKDFNDELAERWGVLRKK